MEVLAPAYLLAAAAAAIPLWLHLRRRRADRRLVFPAVRYLRQARQAYARRLQLRHWLLLAARVGLVIAATLLAAGLLFGRGDARDHPPHRVALVIDPSASTGLVVGDRTAFDLLRERALTSLSLAGPEDRFWIVRATRPEDAAGPLSAAEAAARLRALAPVPGAAHLTAAVSAAAGIVGGGATPAEVHLFSDLQATNLGPATEGIGVPLVVFAPDAAAPPNLAITEARSTQGSVTVGEEPVLGARVEGFGRESLDEEVTVRASVDGRVVRLATAAPGSEVTLVLPAASAGWISGAVEIDPSGLRADDRRFFTIPVRPAVRVALTGGAGPFVEASTTALESGGRLRRVAGPSAAEVVWSTDGEGAAEAVRAARAVLIVPGEDPLAIPRLNARLERVGIGWRFAYDEARGLGQLGPGAERIPGARGQHVRMAYRLEPTAGGGPVWIRLESGEPWLVGSGTSGPAAALLLASPLTDRATDIVTAPAMIPFVDALVHGWPAEGGEWSDPGGGILLPSRATALVLPSGRRRAIEGGSRLWEMEEAGVYAVLAGDSVVRRFAVNVAPEESDLARAPEREIQGRWPGVRLVRGGTERDWAAAIYRDRRGRQAAPWLLALLVALALVESLAAAGRGAEKPAAAVHRRAARVPVG